MTREPDPSPDPPPHREELPDPDATRSLGRRVAAALEPGLCVALLGDLGAGKTALCKAVVAALGPVDEDDVISPTFMLLAEYPGRVPTLHIDAYRLSSGAALCDLGYDLEGEHAVLVEWAERVADALPADRLTLELSHAAPGRVAHLSSSGPRSRRALERILSGA